MTAFENERLKIAKGLPLAEAFIGELQAFPVRFTAKGRYTYAVRSGEHDDLVLADVRNRVDRHVHRAIGAVSDSHGGQQENDEWFSNTEVDHCPQHG